MREKLDATTAFINSRVTRQKKTIKNPPRKIKKKVIIEPNRFEMEREYLIFFFLFGYPFSDRYFFFYGRSTPKWSDFLRTVFHFVFDRKERKKNCANRRIDLKKKQNKKQNTIGRSAANRSHRNDNKRERRKRKRRRKRRRCPDRNVLVNQNFKKKNK